MKTGIHPEYVETTITCACGEVVHTRSTKQNIRIEICSKCHPFFSGKQKFIDTAGRIEKFEKKFKETPIVATKSKARRVAVKPFKMPKSQPVQLPERGSRGGPGGRPAFGKSPSEKAPAKAAAGPAPAKAAGKAPAAPAPAKG